MNRLNQTEPTTFSILLCWAFFRDSVFLYLSLITDVETEAMVKFKTIKPLLERHVLDRDSATRRFNIQGILRECLKSYYTVKDLPGNLTGLDFTNTVLL
jgi:predicted PP-loop superfamily ATPase